MPIIQKSISSINGLADTLTSLQTQIDDMGYVINYVGTLDGGVDALSATDLTTLPLHQKNPGDYFKVTTAGFFTDGTNTIFVNKDEGLIWNLNNQIESFGGGAGGWKWVSKSSADEGYVANSHDAILANTNGSTFGINLPYSPYEGNTIFVFDATNNAKTNPIKIYRNAETIEGLNSDFTINKNGGWAEFIFDGTTWQVRQAILGDLAVTDLNNVGNGLATNLNSDKLDGYDADILGTPDTVVVRDSLSNIELNTAKLNVTSTNTTATNYFYDNGDGKLNKKALIDVKSEIFSGSGSTIISELNNVTGAGTATLLNADLWDGKHFADYFDTNSPLRPNDNVVFSQLSIENGGTPTLILKDLGNGTGGDATNSIKAVTNTDALLWSIGDVVSATGNDTLTIHNENNNTTKFTWGVGSQPGNVEIVGNLNVLDINASNLNVAVAATNTNATHYFVDVDDSGTLQKKTLNNVQTEIVTGSGTRLIAELNSVGSGKATGLNVDTIDGIDSSKLQQRGIKDIDVNRAGFDATLGVYTIQITQDEFNSTAMDVVGDYRVVGETSGGALDGGNDVYLVIPTLNSDNSTVRTFIVDNKVVGNYRLFIVHPDQTSLEKSPEVKYKTRQIFYHETKKDTLGNVIGGEIEGISVSSVDGWTSKQFNKNHVNPPLSYINESTGASLIDEAVTKYRWKVLGDSTLNSIVTDVGPYVHSERIWKVIAGGTPGATQNTGGYETNVIEIDNTKTYRFITFFNKNQVTQDTTTGETYIGIRAFSNNQQIDLTDANSDHIGPRIDLDLDSSGNVAPCFAYPSDYTSVDIVPNDWIMVVGYIHGSGTLQETDLLLNPPHGGVYDTEKVLPVSQAHDYIWPSNATHVSQFGLVRDCTTAGVETQFNRMIIEVADGTETPLGSYFAKNITSRASNTHKSWNVDIDARFDSGNGTPIEYWLSESEFDNATFDFETDQNGTGIHNDITVVVPHGLANVFIADNQNVINNIHKIRLRTAPKPLYSGKGREDQFTPIYHSTTQLVDIVNDWTNSFAFNPDLHDYWLVITNGTGKGERLLINNVDFANGIITFNTANFTPDDTTEYRIEEELDPVGVHVPNGHRVLMYSNGKHIEALTSETVGHIALYYDTDTLDDGVTLKFASGNPQTSIEYPLTMAEFNNVTYDFEPTYPNVEGMHNDVELVIPDGRPKIFVIDNQNKSLEFGTTTSAGSGQIIDSTKTWTVDQWAGYKIYVTLYTTDVNGNTVSTKERVNIVSNTATTLVIDAPLQVNIDDKYSIEFELRVRNNNQGVGTGVLVPNSTRFMMYTTGLHVEGLTAVRRDSNSGVVSFNGRVGEITPSQGDYTPGMVGAIPAAGTSIYTGTMTTESLSSVMFISGPQGSNETGHIGFDNRGFDKPTYTNRSKGLKFALNNNVSSTTTDIGIGISDWNNIGLDTSSATQQGSPVKLWFDCGGTTADHGFEWYAGTNLIAALNSSGKFSFAGGLDLNNQLHISKNTTDNYIKLSNDTGTEVVNIGFNHNGTAVVNPTTTKNIYATTGLELAGELIATSKSFLINHPTKPGKKLRYGSLEGPENGVYVRGRLTDNSTIMLPDYWSGLVDENTITVTVTPIGKHQKLYIENTNINYIKIGNENLFGSIDCFYTIFAERKDIPKLIVEY